MKINLYSIRDEQATFGNPFACPTDGMAIRDFASAVNASPERSALAYAPNDFVLYRIGQFDLETAQVEPEKQAVYLKRGSELIAEK